MTAVEEHEILAGIKTTAFEENDMRFGKFT